MKIVTIATIMTSTRKRWKENDRGTVKANKSGNKNCVVHTECRFTSLRDGKKETDMVMSGRRSRGMTNTNSNCKAYDHTIRP